MAAGASVSKGYPSGLGSTSRTCQTNDGLHGRHEGEQHAPQPSACARDLAQYSDSALTGYYFMVVRGLARKNGPSAHFLPLPFLPR